MAAKEIETLYDRYIEGVLTGVIPSCKKVKLACHRHREDLKRSASPDFSYRFSPALAAKVINFVSALVLTEGIKYPYKKFKPELWQAFVLAMMFGWVRKDDGLRRFRRAHVTVGRKNGKSPLFAAVCLYGLLADKESGAQVYSVATKKDQAGIIFKHGSFFRRHSGNLAQLCEEQRNSIFVRETGSKFQALSSDEEGLDGLNIHIGVVDEYQNHKTDVVFERVNTSTTSRSQPLIITTGTAGTSGEAGQSPMRIEYDYSTHVLEGDFPDETYFAYIAEADRKEVEENADSDKKSVPSYDWEDEETWKKANPNYGISVNPEAMRIEANAAKNEPAKLNAFLRLHLNIWTSQDICWMPMERWRQCSSKIQVVIPDSDKVKILNCRDRLEIEDEMLSQWRIPFAGLDLSERGDLTCLMVLFPPKEDKQWIALPYFFIPGDCIEKRSKNDRVPYDVWVREGLITATPGEVVDYDFVEAEILRLHRKLHVQGLAVDPHNALQLNNKLRGEGVPVVEVQQGYKSLSNPTKELMAWVLSRKLNHLNNPVLNWNAGNIVVSTDAAGNIKPDKSKARERIDGIAALVDAMFLALSQQYSVYSDRGVITI